MADWVATAALVVTRVSAMMLCAPGVGQHWVPWRIRFLLIASLSVPVLCVIPCANLEQTQSIGSLLAHEAIVGISLSLVPAAILFGLQVSVQAVQGMTGLPEANTGNGQDLSTGSSLHRLMLITALAVFFTSSGHRVVFQSVLESFQWLPPGEYRPFNASSDLFLDLLSTSFRLGVRAMAPIGLSLAISLVAVAAINRLLPQLGYFAVGMSVQAMALFAALVLFCGTSVWYLDNSFATASDAPRVAWQLLQTTAQPIAPQGTNP